MNWTKIPTKKIKDNGRTRIRKGFLIFPKVIGNETKWLEFATWKQIRASIGTKNIRNNFWVNIKWM